MTDMQACTETLRFKASANLAKWGMQDPETLALAIAEECGEIAQAVLKMREDCPPLRQRIEHANAEAVDLGALCLQLMLTLNEEPK